MLTPGEANGLVPPAGPQAPLQARERRGYAGSVLSRLRESRWLRAVLLYGTIAFCCYGVVAQWPQVHAAPNHMR
jgi:hypothetical protein